MMRDGCWSRRQGWRGFSAVLLTLPLGGTLEGIVDVASRSRASVLPCCCSAPPPFFGWPRRSSQPQARLESGRRRRLKSPETVRGETRQKLRAPWSPSPNAVTQPPLLVLPPHHHDTTYDAHPDQLSYLHTSTSTCLLVLCRSTVPVELLEAVIMQSVPSRPGPAVASSLFY